MSKLIDTKPGLPSHPRRIHLMGACGVGMAGVAGLFLSTGATVTGSDQSIYPPMSDYLARRGIRILEGYSPLNLNPRPDLVVIGNVIRRDNPEAQAVISQKIPFVSMPEAIEKYFLDGRLSLVVTGTHGKTTLSSMISWILYDNGADPGFVIGGLPSNFNESSRLGCGKMFVIEGDEYDSAFFDKGPKFLHYRPFVGVITSCEFDHGDIYRDLGHIRQAFESFLKLIPEDGAVIACNDDPVVRDIIDAGGFKAITYGSDPDSYWSLSDVKDEGKGVSVEFFRLGVKVASGLLPVVGKHNALNALAAVACVEKMGIEPNKALESLADFRGVQRRQQLIHLRSEILLVDDFAHHPSEVRETLSGFRLRFPDRRLVAVFEPRTNTSRTSIFQESYIESFLAADLSVLREPPDQWKVHKCDLFSSEELSAQLKIRGKEARAFPDTDSIIEFLNSEIKPGDVVIIMSNGSFENLIPRLSKVLEDPGQ